MFGPTADLGHKIMRFVYAEGAQAGLNQCGEDDERQQEHRSGGHRISDTWQLEDKMWFASLVASGCSASASSR